MVVFTSGIVDALLPSGGGLCSLSVRVDGVLVSSRWWGTGSSTLLGPEGSAVRVLPWWWVRVSGLLVLPLPVAVFVMVVGVGGVVV